MAICSLAILLCNLAYTDAGTIGTIEEMKESELEKIDYAQPKVRIYQLENDPILQTGSTPGEGGSEGGEGEDIG